MDKRLIHKYDRPVPRYTSYPAATQFAPVAPAMAAAWLAAIPADSRLSLYVHLPFCKRMCWFCGCHTTIPNRYDRVRDYVGVLEREATLIAGLVPAAPVSAIHWGGGTPTILEPAEIERLAAALRRRFDVAADVEFSVEIDPRGFTQDRARALGAAGVVRASIGVQDLTPEVQKAVNRVQSLEESLQAVEWLRAAGATGVNVDLMYGLPHQTVDGVVATARRVVETIGPDRLAVFGYAHVPWMKRHQRMIRDEALPDAAARFEQAEAAASFLVSAGYVRIGFDHFARPADRLAAAASAGTLHRNFQGYTADDAPILIGLGASAISALPHGYLQNAARLDDYADAIAAGRIAMARGVEVSDEDRLRRLAIERLMCGLALDCAGLAREFGRPADHFADALLALQPLAADGLVTLDRGNIAVTERGRPFLRLVAAAFDEYLQPTARRHARAV